MIKKFKEADEIHLDIMDGTFVPTTSLPLKHLPRIKQQEKIGCHLMVANPLEWIEQINKTKIPLTYIHPSTIDEKKFLKLVKKSKTEIAVALRPSESPQKYKKYIQGVTKILLLTVHPGYYGAKHLAGEQDKIKEIKKINHQCKVTVDGGVSADNKYQLLRKGADMLVVGSEIQKAKDPNQKLQELNKPTIYLSRILPKPTMDRLSEYANLNVHTNLKVKPTQSQLMKAANNADAIITTVTENIDKKIITANKHLKAISNYAIGFNNIDLKTAKNCRIPVTNTPGEFAHTVADHSFALLLALAHRIMEQNDFTKHGKYTQWLPTLFEGWEIRDRTIGIIGLGSIGRAMAQRAAGFDMKIIYHDQFRAPKEIEKKYNAKYVPLEKLLKESDFVSLHVPLLPETTHMITRKELKLMKDSAFIINTARGPVIKEKDLIEALQKKWIAGAGLDVFENEPKHAKVLDKMQNTILTPHTASSTKPARELMGKIVANNVIAALKGETPPNKLN